MTPIMKVTVASSIFTGLLLELHFYGLMGQATLNAGPCCETRFEGSHAVLLPDVISKLSLFGSIREIAKIAYDSAAGCSASLSGVPLSAMNAVVC